MSWTRLVALDRDKQCAGVRAYGQGRRARRGTRFLLVLAPLLALLASRTVWSASAAGSPQGPRTTLVTFDDPGSARAATSGGGSVAVEDPRSKNLSDRVVRAALTPAAADRVRHRPRVVAVEPDAAVSLADAPNDPCYAQPSTCGGVGAWHIDRLGLPGAWNHTHAAGQVIAVLDTGLASPTVGDLQGKVDGEIDATGGAPPCTNDSGGAQNHGTAVASTAGAATNNGLDVAGTGWDVHVLSVRVYSQATPTACGGLVSDVIGGITAARNAGAKIINISSTTTADVVAMHTAVDDAATAGVVVVAAAGNSASSDPTTGQGGYPAAYESVLSVGASTQSDGLASFSNFGPTVDVYAPGVNLPVLDRSGAVAFASGTSFSSPAVAGVVALMRAVQPSLSPAQIIAMLHNTADTTAAGPRVNATAALVAADPRRVVAATGDPLTEPFMNTYLQSVNGTQVLGP